MKSRGSQILFALRVLGILLGIGFLVYQIFSSLRDFNWAILTPNLLTNIALALAVSVIAIGIQMTAWKIMLAGINQSIALGDVFSGFTLSFVARYIPGTIWGYLTRSEWLKREHGIPYAVSNLGSVVETTGYLAANLFFVLQGLFFVRNITFSIVFSIIFLIGSWACLNLLIMWPPTRRLFRLDQNEISRFPILKWIIIFVLCLGIWYCFGFGLMIFANALNIQITFTHSLEMSAIFALAWLIGFVIPFLPTGLGLREFSLTILLISQFGLLKADAAFIAIGFRVIVSLAELIWIIYGLTKKVIPGINKKPIT